MNHLLDSRKKVIRRIGRRGTIEEIYNAMNRLIIGRPYIFDGQKLRTFPFPDSRKLFADHLKRSAETNKDLLVDLSPTAIFVLSRDKVYIYSDGY